MTRLGWVLLGLATVIGLAAATVVMVVVHGVAADARAERNCPENVQAGEAKVRTTRWEWPDELPGAGQYPENAYDELPPQQRWRHVYFDPDRSLVLFGLHDH